MNHIFVRPFRSDETKKAQDSFNSVRGISCLDQDVFTYPSTTILVAESDKPLMYLPVQKCYVLESLGPTEEATDREIAASLKALTQILVWESRKAGQGEIYFACNHEPTQKFAMAHGYEEVPIKFFRRKV